MNVDILKKIPIPVSKLPFVPIDAAGKYLAFSTPLSEGIFVHPLYSTTESDSSDEDVVEERKTPTEHFKLNGVHQSGVQFLSFGQRDPPLLLATACSDEINIWHFSSLDGNNCTEHYTIAQNLGSVQCMCFSNDDSNLAISISNEVWVISTQSAELICQFHGDNVFAMFMEFCCTLENLLVTLTDERTYRIYDINTKDQIYQSSIMSSFPLLSMSMHPSESYFAIGSADGILRVFDMTLHNSLHEINVAQAVNKKLNDANTTEQQIISLKYWKRKSIIAQSRLAEELYLAVGCEDCFLIYNANSMDMIHLFMFDYNVLDNGLSNDYKVFSFATQIDFSSGLVQNELKVTVISSPSNTIHVYRVQPDHYDVALALELMSVIKTDITLPTSLSKLLPFGAMWLFFLLLFTVVITLKFRDPLLDTSPLKASLTPKEKPAPNAKSKTSKNRPIKKKTDKMNQPVTFNKKVSSSGYTSEKPRRQMFAPQTQTNQSKTKKLSNKSSASPSNKSSASPSNKSSASLSNKSSASPSNKSSASLSNRTNTSNTGSANHKSGSKKNALKNPVGPWGLKTDTRELKADYPIDSDPPIHLTNTVKLTETPTPINDMCFSDSGKSVLCALSDNSLLMSKTKSMKDATCYTGHSATLNSCGMGHQNGYMVTASNDCTVKYWTPNQSEPLMTMTHYRHNFKQDDNNPAVNKKNPRFSKEISKACFYFIDKFVLLSQGKTLCLYSYHVDPIKNEVKRYENKSKYKMVKDFEISETQTITTFSAINSFYSYYYLEDNVICACSNRDLAIFDMNHGEQVHTIKDAHTRPVHSIYQIQGSSYVSLSPETYNLFVTSAQSDGVKLWDTRTMKCVRKYEGHLNRAQKVGLTVSPCAKFIAVGSEDKSTYIYDIRSNSYLHCLSGQNDTVSALAFHPQKPLLVSASCSGTICSYSDVEIK